MGHKKIPTKVEISIVGMTRFELATPRPPDVCATGLRYIPKFFLPDLCPASSGTTSRNIEVAKVLEIFNSEKNNLPYLCATLAT